LTTIQGRKAQEKSLISSLVPLTATRQLVVLSGNLVILEALVKKENENVKQAKEKATQLKNKVMASEYT
jgi:hypothetical protein